MRLAYSTTTESRANAIADAAAMEAALKSEIGQRVAADVRNYSPNPPNLSHYRVEHG